MNSHDAQHSKRNKNVQGETENTSSSAGSNAVTPELTLVLIGNKDSIEIGSKNILLDNDKEIHEKEFSSRLYDLFARQISLINMLGFPNIETVPVIKDDHAFILLISNGLHDSQYTSGMQWLERKFGKEHSSYVMTVVTHDSDDICESALQDLKAKSSFSEKRYHTCTRSMINENEIVALLKKIDDLVSENRLMTEGQEAHQYEILKTEQRKKGETKLKTTLGEDSEMNDDSRELHKEGQEKEGGMEISKENVGGKGSEINNKHTGEKSEINTASCELTRESNILQQHPSTTPPTHSGAINVDGNKEKPLCNSSEEERKIPPKETEMLFKRLELQDKSQTNWSPKECLQIGRPVKQTNEISEKDLAYAFLQRLMMLDYRARYIPVKQESLDVSNSQAVHMSKSEDTDDDDLDAFYSTNIESDKSKENQVHPMDVQMAVFHCSDSFLKQKMITKLSQCQYALPLLVPDLVTTNIECPLWTFRQITKTWKISTTKDNSTTVTMKSMPVYKAETPMVSFFRLGTTSLSKSQLMNALINDRHNTFFHRNCPGSTKSRHLMDGVAEIAWYCPAGKPNDFFFDCIAFCNLHGDSLAIVKQREILTEMSSVIVVLVPTLDKSHESSEVISMLYKSSKPLIVLIADNECSAVEIKPQKYKLGLKEKSQSDVSEELKKIIRNILCGPHTSFQLETMAKVSGVRVDEDTEVCQNGKSVAMEPVKLIERMDVSEIKEKFLPCQGQLLHDWCKINKELHHLKGNIEKEKDQKIDQLLKLRQKQCDVSNSELMTLFTESLEGLPPNDREYFLKWTQILIDALSTDDLSSILQSYDETWSEILVLKKKHDKKKHDKSAQLNEKQAELEHLSKKLQSATFGLEHFFREMGQIYEAHKSLKEPSLGRRAVWTKYPELAADLMIKGHPIELMDGDAGHVPLIWISSLLKEVIKKLGDQKVFVLSVLGVQSSGKSTMLNAMFGLQFAVSAGRCTKGAYMQLVKLSEDIKKDYKFEYVLVVDTEGLRALELAGNSTLHHDNELATFVVGLGNMTLINIFGENPAEMQDVLQIVVQAFMRMKKVKLSPSCVFVHQNVTDISATEKNMDGKRRLQEKLDKMTQLAAKEEVCDVECFSDVIAFDVEKDVKYFAQLWEGSPPMAPPNPGYSESVQELKAVILSKASQSSGILLSHFNAKIQDLWNALMNEHFVFSFKNTQEISVYRKLEEQYGNWTWALRSEMLKIENELFPRIEKGQLDKVDKVDLEKQMSKKYTEITKDFVAYFEDDKDKEMLVQWRNQYKIKIKEFQEELISGVKRKLDAHIQQNNARKKLDNKKTEFENKLFQESKELAHLLKCTDADEEELKGQFNTVWSHLVEDLTYNTNPIENIDLQKDQFNVLRHLGVERSLIDESKQSQKYKHLSETGNYCCYTTHKTESEQSKKNKRKADRDTGRQSNSSFAFVQKIIAMASTTQHEEEHKSKNSFQHEEQEMIRSFINQVEQECLEAMKSKPVATRGYSSTYLQELANHVKQKVTEFESGRKYTFKKEFTVDLSLYVFDRAESWLLQSHKTYKDNNDVFTYLDSKKKEYYNIFRSFCKGSSSAIVFGEMMCKNLKVSAVEAVCNNTGVDIAGEMMGSFPAFSGNRLKLEKHVLASLAEKKDFDRFITYIRNPRKQVEAFIKEEVEKYMFGTKKGKAQSVLNKNVEDITRLVSQALFEATEEVKNKKGDIEMWVEEFSSKLGPNLTLDTISCQNFSDINNFDFLKEELDKGFKNIRREMNSLSLNKVNECRQKPEQILIDQKCNCCWERCPFCAAVCTNTLKDHSPDKHSVPFHRPSGVTGWHIRGTVDLVIDFCTTLVASDRSFYPEHDSEQSFPFKQYPTAGEKYASWSITADASKLAYWKWFVCHFQKELEDYYNLKFQGRGEIPQQWKHLKKDAIESLNEMCSL